MNTEVTYPGQAGKCYCQALPWHVCSFIAKLCIVYYPGGTFYPLRPGHKTLPLTTVDNALVLFRRTSSWLLWINLGTRTTRLGLGKDR